MGKCKYCGQSAGLFSSEHRDCKDKHDNGIQQVQNEIINYFSSPNSKDLRLSISEISEQSHIQEGELHRLLLFAYEKAVGICLEDGLMSENELELLQKYQDTFGITTEELDSVGARTKVIKNLVLQDVMNGNVTHSRIVIGDNPFLFDKDEFALWSFTNVPLYEIKTQTHFQGGSQGVSIRVAKGFYYRVGAFRGQPIKTEEMKNTAMGAIVLTNKNLYFGSNTKNLKIKYTNIMSMPTFEDAIGIQQTRTNAKVIYFKNIDVWFMFNLISNLKLQS